MVGVSVVDHVPPGGVYVMVLLVKTMFYLVYVWRVLVSLIMF